MGPTTLALLPRGQAGDYIVSSLALILMLYSRSLAKLIGEDYWGRQRTHALLERRAFELETLSRTDSLTHIANRLKFQEALTQNWRDASRRDEPVALAMVDLDHFKRINDRHGHPFGDRCLEAAAAALTAAICRPHDLVARYGGEEFVILMYNTDLGGAKAVADQALALIAATQVSDGEHAVTLSCSIGVTAMQPSQSCRQEQLVSTADWALYQAKQAGRARVICDTLVDRNDSKQTSQKLTCSI